MGSSGRLEAAKMNSGNVRQSDYLVVGGRGHLNIFIGSLNTSLWVEKDTCISSLAV